MSEHALLSNEMGYFEFIYKEKKERIYEDRTYKDLTELKKGIASEFPDEIYFSNELGLYKGIDELGETLELFLYSMTHETDSKKVIICGIYDS